MVLPVLGAAAEKALVPAPTALGAAAAQLMEAPPQVLLQQQTAVVVAGVLLR
jgi:hypothetical protein